MSIGDETLKAYIWEWLETLYTERLKREGWWCPRCDMEAPPWDAHAPLGTPGVCRMCGMDPLCEGPPPRRELRGILSA